MTYFSLITAIVALAIEVLVFLSLMEMPPFGKGDSDIIWALPFFGLIVFGLGISGFIAALNHRRNAARRSNLGNAALLLNGVTVAIPILLLGLAVGRVLLAPGGLMHH